MTQTFDDTTCDPQYRLLYLVRAVSSTGICGDSSKDLATTVLFTDDPLVAASTTIKAAHLSELRTAVNAVRTLADLSPSAVTDPSPYAVSVKAVHVTELRTALNAARAALSLTAISYRHSIAAGGRIDAIDFRELRTGVK